MPISHNGIARGSNPRSFKTSPSDSGYGRFPNRTVYRLLVNKNESSSELF